MGEPKIGDDRAIDIAQLLDRLRDGTVLCVGDLMLDRFVEGGVDRISPEAPIPVLTVRNEREALGGVGNVARNISALGGRALVVAAIGDDDAGRKMQDDLNGIDGVAAHLVTAGDRPTGVKTRYMASGQQLLRADREKLGALLAEDAEAIKAKAVQCLDRVGALILSDYGKGVLTPNTIMALIQAANSAGIPVLVDPKGRDFTIYRGADLLTPNRAELAEASGLPTGTDQEVTDACAQIVAQAGVGGLLATRSEQGMTLFRANATPSGTAAIETLPTRAREIYDVVGAGDTVVAAMALGLAAGIAAPEAAQLANRAAGVVVGKVGTAVAYPAEILADAHEDAFHGAEAKCVTLAAARDRVDAWRRDGRTVGFTNGCFDLLHPGHVSLIDQAAAACDRLVLGLNSDDSVRRLKGAGRPVQPEGSRATVLASLAKVDLVVVFGEDTPLDLIEALRPDVLVKGADYTRETVVGARQVESWGGRVLLADLVEGQSTTRTLKKISEN